MKQGKKLAKMEANKTVLDGNSKNIDSCKTYTCKECSDRDFETASKLKYHRLKNHGKWLGMSFKCSDCDKSFGTNSNLKKHQKFVCGKTVQNNMVCSDCNYTTHDLYNMKVHQRKHTGERPYICTLCNYGFYKASDLNKHKKSCKGLQLNCPHCHTSFHFRTKLTHHLTWSETCGSVRDKFGQATDQSDVPMIRLNTEKVSVIAFNCNELLDKNIFVEKKKKSKCGICSGCELSTNCGKCNNCLGKTKKTQCLLRKCVNLMREFDVKKDQVENANFFIQKITNDAASKTDHRLDDEIVEFFQEEDFHEDQ